MVLWLCKLCIVVLWSTKSPCTIPLAPFKSKPYCITMICGRKASSKATNVMHIIKHAPKNRVVRP